MSLSGLSELRKHIEIGQTLVAEKLEQWEWFSRFVEMNPDVKLRWEQHKTYEILKDEH
jgi:hypothetical protein